MIKICKNCGKQMQKDDVDFNFRGNYDIYWVCDSCSTSCIEKIRFGKIFKEEWYQDK